MNFLAHIWLSGADPEIRLGNFLGDTIKGKEFDLLSDKMKKGVLLHRRIDHFVDLHGLFKRDLQLLKPFFGKYAPVGLDVLYDYILAKNFSDFSAIPLSTFSFQFYQFGQDNLNVLPDRSRFLMSKIIEKDWLNQYAYPEGIGNIMNQMDQRSKYATGFSSSEKVIQLFEDQLTVSFQQIIYDLKKVSNAFLEVD